MPEPIGTAKVGLVQKRAGYDLCKTSLATTNVVIKTSAYPITVNDYIIICNSSTPFTVTLPAAALGLLYIIKNIGSGVVTIACDGADTIDTLPTQEVDQYACPQVFCYVANKWIII